MKPSILYISYTGLLEPLGQSQVLQYLLGLAQEHRITLLTFEKPTALVDHSVLERTKATCRQARVDWHYLHYHNKPNLLATIYDVLAGTMKAIKLARSENADVVHCRSYLGGLMGLAVKRATGAHHIFDMRGFWADERVDGGIWRKGGFKYRLFKWLERLLLCETDHIVTLTRSGRHEIYKFPYFNVGRPPISVIPTCVNLKLFQSRPEGINNGTDFTLGYVGSIGTWYLFEEVSRVVKPMFDDYPNSRFLVLNKGSHDNIRQQLSREGVDLSRVEIKAVEFDRVSDEIARMDAGIFFYKPMWSKRASCPTKMGEFLAMGKPCFANIGVGDVEEDLHDTRTGVTVSMFDQMSLIHGLHELIALTKEDGTAARCRTAAKTRFSLDSGVKKYGAIYASLTNTSTVSS